MIPFVNHLCGELHDNVDAVYESFFTEEGDMIEDEEMYERACDSLENLRDNCQRAIDDLEAETKQADA